MHRRGGIPGGMANDLSKLASDAFHIFQTEAPAHAQAWMAAVQGLGAASALDEKTRALVYLGVLAALRMESGLPFHAAHARRLGATRAEVISAVLTGLPAAGMAVVAALPAVTRAFEGEPA
jgi:alkylhydroperoxidase/carboxymuconolactone decarboxylase family protein YurZ